MAYLRTAFEEPKQKEWERNPVEAAAKQRQWARSNRARLAKCTGMDKVVFQLVGESADAHMLDLVRQEIARFLGGEGLVDGFEVVIESLPAPGLLDPLGSNEDKVQGRRRGPQAGIAHRVRENWSSDPVPDAGGS